MKKRVLAVLLAVIMIAAIPMGAFATDISDFTDVKEDDWFYDAVDYAVEKDLFSGTGKDKFSPNAPMTRAMFVTVLARKSNITTDYQSSMRFTDVPKGQWYSNPIAWASKYGIVSGTSSTKFDPDGNISREQMATILFRYATKTGNDISYTSDKYENFPDMDNTAIYAQESMKWATHHGVINGIGDKLEPKEKATRAQVAQIFKNSDSLLVKTEIITKPIPDPNPLPDPLPDVKGFTVYSCGYKVTMGDKIEDALKNLPEPNEVLLNSSPKVDRYFFGTDKNNAFYVLVYEGIVSGISACSDDTVMMGYTQNGPTGDWKGEKKRIEYKGEKKRAFIGTSDHGDIFDDSIITKKMIYCVDVKALGYYNISMDSPDVYLFAWAEFEMKEGMHRARSEADK